VATVRAIERAALFAKHRIPFYVMSNAAKPSGAQVGLLPVRRLAFSGRPGTGVLVLLIAPPSLSRQPDAERRQPPLSFSMNGLTG
jgi:hypothetical protein